MHSNRYTLLFAMAITIVASILLASAATLLKPYQVRNEALDVKKNILMAATLIDVKTKKYSSNDIESIYDENIVSSVVNTSGHLLESKKVTDIDPKVDLDLLPVFRNVIDGETRAYILPISGKGLWSTIYGYIALEPDMNTVKGITFYKHGETPGLGGEIEKSFFTDNFKGKKIFSGQELVSINIAKGKAINPGEHTVDGISGSTLTCVGVQNFILANLNTYLPYIHLIQKEVN